MINELIGIPFKNKGRTLEDGFDCWGLVKHIHGVRTGEELPDFIYSKADNVANSMYFIEQVTGPKWEKSTNTEGSVIVFNIGGVMKHAGYMLDNRHFIHVMKDTRVLIEDIANPIWTNRIAGYWRFNGSL